MTTYTLEGKQMVVDEKRLIDLANRWLPKGMSAQDCNKYMRALENPIDIGVYPPEFHMPENIVFINAYNLKEAEVPVVAKALIDFIHQA